VNRTGLAWPGEKMHKRYGGSQEESLIGKKKKKAATDSSEFLYLIDKT